MPPSRSGIAAYSVEILPLLRSRFAVDAFVDRAPLPAERDVFSAHDFVWKHRRRPYDLTVYQLGNATCHGYMWAYLLRYPGLVVLHDAQLHQARALWLMKRHLPRYDDYISEFHATEPHAPADGAYLIAAGLGKPAFYQHWPLVRLVLESARLAVVHGEWLRASLEERYPQVTVDSIEMGVADPWAALPFPMKEEGESLKATSTLAAADHMAEARRLVRQAHRIPAQATLVAAYGGVTPEKRITSLFRAIAELCDRVPALHVMLVGEEAEHYDARAEAARCGVADRLRITGFVADEQLPTYLAAADICSCLRWPTNRETSASWLRCLAAGKPTLITALAQYASLSDVAVSIDVLDEEHALPRALESLALDAAYRTDLAGRARKHWEAHHQLAQMAGDYERVIARAASRQAPHPALPAHMRNDGGETLCAIARDIGVATELADRGWR